MTKPDKKNENPHDSQVLASGVISSERQVSRRDFLGLAGSALAAVAASSLTGGCATDSDVDVQPTNTPGIPGGTINFDETSLLGTPGDLDSVLLLLGAGAIVNILERDATNTWYKVRTVDGDEGWIEKKKITVSPSFVTTIDEQAPINYEIHPLPTPEKITVTVTGTTRSTIELRSAPGDNDKITIELKPGESVEILERDSTDQYYKVRTSNNRIGWVKKSQIEIDVEYRSTVNIYVEINPSVKPVDSAPKPPDHPPSNNPPAGGTHYWYPN